MEKTKRKHILKLCIKLAFTAIALYLVYTKVDFSVFALIWTHANPWFFIPAFVCYIISQLIASFRLLNFFRNIRLPVTVVYNLRLYLKGLFYNIFLPGGIGGDGYKIVVLTKQFREKPRVIFTAVFLDRVTGAWAVSFLIILIGIIVEAVPAFANMATAAFITGTVLYYFIIRKYFTKHARRFAAVHALALLVQVFQSLCVFFVLLALGHEDYKLPYIFIFLLSSFATLFPFTLGGLGAREIAIVWGAAALSLNKNLSVSVSLCFYVITALVSLLGTVFIFSRDPGKQWSAPGEAELNSSGRKGIS